MRAVASACNVSSACFSEAAIQCWASLAVSQHVLELESDATGNPPYPMLMLLW